MTAMGPTIFVIDDHESVRLALAEMLRVFGFAVETHASADAFLEELDHAGTKAAPRPGCIVADVRMPGIDGVALVRELARRGAQLPVVLISGHADVPTAVAAIKAGADDFIEKPIDDAKLVAAINRGLARFLERQDRARNDDELRQRFARLTHRQVEIFDLVASGMTSHAIGGQLGLSTRTVESYRAQVMEKMQADSVAGLLRQAIRLGRAIP